MECTFKSLKRDWEDLSYGILFHSYDKDVSDLLNTITEDIDKIKNIIQEREDIKNTDDEMLKIAKGCLLSLKCNRVYFYKANVLEPAKMFVKYLNEKENLNADYMIDMVSLSLMIIFDDIEKSKSILEKFIKERENGK